MPVLSIVIPVYNSAPYLRQCLDSVRTQSFQDWEAICVDDGSDDGSDEIIKEYCSQDPRFNYIRGESRGAGAARNLGVRKAAGRFVHFLDSDDWIVPDAYSIIIRKMEMSGVDVCVFQKYSYDNNTGIATVSIRSFDTNDYVTNFNSNPSFFIHSPVVPWNKITKRRVIIDNDLRYDEIVCANDRSFYFSLLQVADSIMVTKDILLYYRMNNKKSLVGTTRLVNFDAHFKAYRSTMAAYEGSSDRMKAMVANEAIVDFMKFFNDANQFYRLKIYFQINEFLNKTDMSFFGDRIHTGYPWSWDIFYIKNFRYRYPLYELRKRLGRRMREKPARSSDAASAVHDDVIVSMTSYPGRMGTIDQTIRTLMKQTVKPEAIVLWLSEEQFPGGKKDVPASVLSLLGRGLDIQFRKGDLKPHKKYFYALQEFPDKIVITVDDDILYEPDTIEKLMESYRLFPNAVSAMRVHRILFSEGKVKPYSEWKLNDPSFFRNPSRLAMATGAGGVLYPPGIMPESLFDEEAIMDTCLFGDDLWLKTNELLAGIPVVLAAPSRELAYVEGTQSEALWIDNKEGGRNDSQIAGISSLFEDGGPWCSMEDGFMHSVKAISYLMDCTDLRSAESVEEFRKQMPENSELVCYEIASDEVGEALFSYFYLDPQVTLIRRQEFFRTSLTEIKKCANSRSFIFIDGGMSYGTDFYSRTMKLCDGAPHYDDAVLIRSSPRPSVAKEGFDRYASVIPWDLLHRSGLQHLDDSLSQEILMLCSGSGKVALNVDNIRSGLYNPRSLERIRSVMAENGCRSEACESDSLAVEISRFLNSEIPDEESDVYDLDQLSVFRSGPLASRMKYCPVCCNISPRFQVFGKNLRDDAVCSECGSLERHRTVFAYLRNASAGNSSMSLINFPGGFKSFVGPKFDFTGLSNVDRWSDSDVVLMSHSISKSENLDMVMRGMSKRTASLFLITIDAKKDKEGTRHLASTGKILPEVISDMESAGYDVSLLSSMDMFDTSDIELYSLINDEMMLVCRKRRFEL
jgi:glycosyltransferase involved in cell wall biosynthesis